MKAVVFEGGGIIASGQVAILQALKEKGLFNLKEYSIFVGTSGGALNAAALALGLEPEDVVRMWKTVKEKDIMPKRLFSIMGKRDNLLDVFIDNTMIPLARSILKKNWLEPGMTMKELKRGSGKELYTVSTCLQNNKGVIFGHDWHNVSVAKAVKYSCSHPLKFDTNKYISSDGKVYDLTDGGLIQNCPVAVVSNRLDLEEVLCISVGMPTDETKRYTATIDIIKRIVLSLTDRNEYMSYYFGHSIWGDRCKVIRSVVDRVDIFDVSAIPNVIKQSYEYAKSSEPKPIISWLPRSLNLNQIIINKLMM